MALGAMYDVLTASNTFEPSVQNNQTLVAEITIKPLKNIDNDNNDA